MARADRSSYFEYARAMTNIRATCDTIVKFWRIVDNDSAYCILTNHYCIADGSIYDILV